jgi:hypothetical protein
VVSALSRKRGGKEGIVSLERVKRGVVKGWM